MSNHSFPSTSVHNDTGRQQKRAGTILQRHPLITFFVLAYSITWLTLLALLLGGSLATQAEQFSLSFLLLTTLSAYGPTLAALFMLLVLHNPDETRAFFRRIVTWRVSPWWYLIALLLPASIMLAGAGLVILLNGGQMTFQLPSGLVAFYVVINLGEELGWRGFALPHLLSRFNALTASIILGVLWAFWHTLVYISTPLLFAFFIVYVVAMSIIMTWIFIHTKGSILLMLLFHWSIDATLSFFRFSPALQQPQTMGLTAVVMCVVAGFLILRYGPSLSSSPATSVVAITTRDMR
jgi:membrane protease YdiL (CAAX protease family)